MDNTMSKIKLNKSKEIKKLLVAYSFILPNFVGFFIFALIPIVVSFILSFAQWNSLNPIKFIGFKNFSRLLTDETFKISFLNTIYFAAATVPLTLVCSLGLAVLLNNQMRGVKAFRAMMFSPYITSTVAIGIVWNLLFHPTMGPINEFLKHIGIHNLPEWTASTEWAMPAVIIVSVWKGMGYYMVMYLAGLQGIPGELYEAAEVDGASKWQSFKSITIPMLTPTTFLVGVMLTISSFKVFDLILVMTAGGPGRATNVLVYQIYNEAFLNLKFGYSSAISMVLFVLVITITIIQFKFEEKWVNYF